MTAKDKLAATLLNHWYCVERALKIERLKRVPSLKEKYTKLEELDGADENAVLTLTREFAEYNSKCFHSNINHLVENDEIVKELGAKCSTLKRSKDILVTASLDPEKGKEIKSFLAAVSGPEQDKVFRDVIDKTPKLQNGVSSSEFHCKILCHYNNFYENFGSLEKTFIDAWNAFKTTLSAYKYVFSLLSEEDKKEVLAERAHINLKSPRVEDNTFIADGFDVVETPEAKATREIRERLMAALKRRTKSVKEVAIHNEAVEYIFDEEGLEPFRVNLDVVTHW